MIVRLVGARVPDERFKLTISAMAAVDSDITKLVVRLYEINAFKFGNFKMKIGANSPVYFDLRVIVSFPDVVVSFIIFN